MKKRSVPTSKAGIGLGIALIIFTQSFGWLTGIERAGAEIIVSAAEVQSLADTPGITGENEAATPSADTSAAPSMPVFDSEMGAVQTEGGPASSADSTASADPTAPPANTPAVTSAPPANTPAAVTPAVTSMPPAVTPAVTSAPPAATPAVTSAPPAATPTVTAAPVISPTPPEETPAADPAPSDSPAPATPTPTAQPSDASNGGSKSGVAPKPSISPEAEEPSAPLPIDWDLSGVAVKKELKNFFETYLLDAQLITMCSNQLDNMADNNAEQLYIAWKTGGKELIQFIAERFNTMGAGLPAVQTLGMTPGVLLDFDRQASAADVTVTSGDGKSVTMFADTYGKYRVDLHFTIENTTLEDKKLDMLLLQDIPWADSEKEVGFDYLSRESGNFRITCNGVVYDSSEITLQKDYQKDGYSGVLLMLVPAGASAMISSGASADVTVSYWLQAKMSPVAGVYNVQTSRNYTQSDTGTQCSALLGAAHTNIQMPDAPDPSLEMIAKTETFGEPSVSLPAQCRFTAGNPYNVFLKGSSQTLQTTIALQKTGRNLADLNAEPAREIDVASMLPAAWLDVQEVLKNYQLPAVSAAKDGSAPVLSDAVLKEAVNGPAESYVTAEIPMIIDADMIQGEYKLIPKLNGLAEVSAPFVIAGISTSVNVTLKGEKGPNDSESEGIFDVVTAFTDKEGNAQVVHAPFLLSKENDHTAKMAYVIPQNLVSGKLEFGVYAPYGYSTETRETDFAGAGSVMTELSSNYYKAHQNEEYKPDDFIAYIHEELQKNPSELEINLTVTPVAKPWIRAWSFLGMVRWEAFLEERRLAL